MTEDDIQALVDPVISFLFSITPNFFSAKSYGRSTSISLYYSRDDFIEVHDDLILAFKNFLYYYDICSERSFEVIRVDNFDTLFLEYENAGEIKDIYAQYKSDLEDSAKIRFEF